MGRRTWWAAGAVWLAGVGAMAWLTPTRPRWELTTTEFVAFSPDGRAAAVRTIAADAPDKVLNAIIDVWTGRQIGEFATPPPHTDAKVEPGPGSQVAADRWAKDGSGRWTYTDESLPAPRSPTVPLVPPHEASRSKPGTADELTLARGDTGHIAVAWSAPSAGCRLAVHDAATGRPRWSVPFTAGTGDQRQAWHPAACAFSPDGRWLAVHVPIGAGDGHDGLAVYDANTGRLAVRLPTAGRLPNADRPAFAVDSTAVYAIDRPAEHDRFVRGDLATGRADIVVEYSARLADIDPTAAMFFLEWQVPPALCADGRVIAARVALPTDPEGWSSKATALFTRLTTTRDVPRLPVQYLDVSTGRILRRCRSAGFYSYISPDGATVAAVSERNDRSMLELWDVPPRRSLAWQVGGGLAWTLVVAVVVCVWALMRRRSFRSPRRRFGGEG